MNFFEPSDFDILAGHEDDDSDEHEVNLVERSVLAARLANHKLQYLLENAPEVFAQMPPGLDATPSGWFLKLGFGGPTHKARLFMVERLK